MVGLLFLATAFLACVQVYGATIPTQDMQVREVNWWIVKHAMLDGRIGWSADHALANAPAGFDMPAVFFSSVLTCDLPDAASNRPTSVDGRERWNDRIKTSVLAGKTVNAMLCLVGILLTTVHLGRRWGILSGLFVSLVLLSTPGIAELTRLGRTEALVGVWAAALMVIWQTWNDSRSDKLPLGLLWGFLLAGAFSSGYGSAVFVGLPAVILGFANRVGGPRAAATRVVFVGVAIAACAFFVRNAAASGDPISPWGKVFLAHFVGAIKPDYQVDALVHAHRIPFETVSESIAAESIESHFNIADSIETPYRLVNLLDGILRFFGNSNVHGLMLMPFAVVGCIVGGLKKSRVAIAWVLYWMVLWWVGSMRLDRDWVGSLFLLAWPAALGANWIAGLFRGYAMFAFVLIAILWSVVVIPIWPTSDNRILVALAGIETRTSAKTSEEDLETSNYSREFNDWQKNNGSFNTKTKILLIGENDDFDLLADCVSSGPFDDGLFDKWIDLSAQQIVAAIGRQEISHLLVVWSGVRYRGKLTGRDRENDYRNAIEGMLKGSQLQLIPLGMNSSQAELFLVNRE